MRKLCVLVMLMLMCCLPALAEETDPLCVDAEAKVLEGIAGLAQSESGWKKAMMEHTTVVSSKRGKEYVTVKVAIPTLNCAVSAKEQPGEDAREYLTRALAGATDWEDTAEYTISIAIKGKSDAATLTFEAAKTLGNYKKKVSGLAASAAKTYVDTQMRNAMYSYLLPRAADMPKSKPEAMPELSPLTDYCAAAATALGLTDEQASERLPAMLLLMQLTKAEAAAGLESTVITVKVKDWQAMLESADALAREAMTAMMGVPEMPRSEIEAILTQQLPEACRGVYYNGKTPKTMTLTVDLAAAVAEGVQTADSLMAYLAEYSAALDTYVDGLMAYAATLDYYPETEQIDTVILAGESAESGARVFFDTDGENHGYVYITRENMPVLTGFIHSGARLMVTLEPGLYEVWCSTGPTWYGVNYAFGRESFCGVFTMEVPEDGNLRIILADSEGSLPVERVTYEDFAVEIQQ
ncbi:MAG: hypothetical protein ACI4ML_08650 [Aristaeellaceae bacterium]